MSTTPDPAPLNDPADLAAGRPMRILVESVRAFALLNFLRDYAQGVPDYDQTGDALTINPVYLEEAACENCHEYVLLEYELLEIARLATGRKVVLPAQVASPS